MLSRRNIRIKVLQSLYAASRSPKVAKNSDLVVNTYRQSIDRSYKLYLFCFLQILKTTEYAVKDFNARKKKHLPSEYDKKFTAKLYQNPLIQSAIQSSDFQYLVQKHQLADKISADSTRLLYIEFAKTPEYKAYIQEQTTNHLKILLFLFKFSVTGETFNELMDDHYANWWDDKSLVIGAIKKTLKALPVAENEKMFSAMRPEFDTVTEFGEALLVNVLKEDQKLLEIIEPTLNNWDADRVAIIDMIILKMALGELLHFPTIPTKVTLNEFVEIAKLYSTEKSKDFINGILDRLLKKLDKDGTIVKQGRGLV